MKNKIRTTVGIGIALITLALASLWLLVPNQAGAASVTAFSGDDWNTSTTTDLSGLYYSCPWIDNGLTAFTNANSGWNFTYATPADRAFLANDLRVVSYYPWVVNQPTYTRDGRTWGGTLNGEAGGAFIELSYTPQPGDPVNVRWIQGVGAIYRGGGPYDGGHLDNPSDRSSPFYDFGANDLAGPTYFVDIPGALENEYEGNPVADVDFQAFLAQDFGARNGFDHDVLIYGGVWWDYVYTATDVPEPSTWALFLAAAFSFRLYGRKKRMA